MKVSSSPFCQVPQVVYLPALQPPGLTPVPSLPAPATLVFCLPEEGPVSATRMTDPLIGKHFSQLCKWLAPSQPRHSLLRETSQSSGFWKAHSWGTGHLGWPVTLSTFVLRVLFTDDIAVPENPTALGHGQ